MAEDIYLARSWDKDKRKISQALARLEDFPSPVWLHIFPEGTRKTNEKLLESQKFAQSRGLQVLQNHLTPRTKGFSFALSETAQRKESFSTVLDLTVIPAKGSEELTFKNILCGKSTSANIFLRKYDVKDIPVDEELSGEWLRQLFLEKDELVSKYYDEDNLENLSKINNVFKTSHTLKPSIWTLVVASVMMVSAPSYFVYILWSASFPVWVAVSLLIAAGLRAMKLLFGATEIKQKKA